MVDDPVEQALIKAKQGDRIAAQEILARALKLDAKNAKAWYLLSQVVEMPDRKEFCLKKVLEIQPDNHQALEKLNSIRKNRADFDVWKSNVHDRGPNWLLISLIISVLITIVGASYWYYYYGPCGIRRINYALEEFYPLIEDLANELNYASLIIVSPNSINKFGLAQSSSDMEAIRQKIEEVQVPSCMNHAKSLIVESAQAGVDVLNLLMQNSDVDSKTKEAKDKMDAAMAEQKRIISCAPFCDNSK